MHAAIGPILAAGFGAVTWTFLEYGIHRWFGHDKRFRRTPFGIEHLRHHVEGDYFAPTWKKAATAAVVTALLVAPVIWIAGAAHGLAYLAGLMGFYGFYEALHRRLHTHAGVGPHGRWARKHHFRHHLVDGRTNFGVTTPLWDVVFRTYRRPPAVIQVPPRLCMSWLLDPATGAVRADQAGRFALGKPSR
jgi:sterol desaturase/sphingolipid hydroxylase (fatty acid hydroxylase superfamily)